MSDILIVEDDTATRAALVILFQADGLAADAVSNGRAAPDYLRTRPAPPLVLLDLMMPVMDGWQFLAELQKGAALAAVSVVVFTAAAGFDAVALRGLGAADVIHKPADEAELLRVANHYCPARPRTLRQPTPSAVRGSMAS
jgi:DNA-binding response OmpR family regulator